MFVVFDPRGELKGVIPEHYLAGYAGNATVAAPLAAASKLTRPNVSWAPGMTTTDALR